MPKALQFANGKFGKNTKFHVNCFYNNRQPLIFYAATYATPQILELLLESGVAINATWAGKPRTPPIKNQFMADTALNTAIVKNRADNVRVLFAHGAEVEIDQYRFAPSPEVKFAIMEAVHREVLRRFGDD